MPDVQFASENSPAEVPPTPSTPYSLSVNVVDGKLWMVSATGDPLQIITVRPFLTTARYLTTDESLVLYQGEIWRCTTNHGPGAWNASNFFKITGLSGLITAGPDSLVVGPNDYTDWLAGIAAAVARIVSYATTSITILHLSAKAGLQTWLNLSNSNKKSVVRFKENANAAPVLEMLSQSEVVKLFFDLSNADPFFVLGGTSADRAASTMLTVKGALEVDALKVNGNFTGANTAGEWTNPVILGPSGTPVYLWGNAAGRLMWKANATPTSISDGTQI